jgi:hypothetical protein
MLGTYIHTYIHELIDGLHLSTDVNDYHHNDLQVNDSGTQNDILSHTLTPTVRNTHCIPKVYAD